MAHYVAQQHLLCNLDPKDHGYKNVKEKRAKSFKKIERFALEHPDQKKAMQTIKICYDRQRYFIDVAKVQGRK